MQTKHNICILQILQALYLNRLCVCLDSGWISLTQCECFTAPRFNKYNLTVSNSVAQNGIYYYVLSIAKVILKIRQLVSKFNFYSDKIYDLKHKDIKLYVNWAHIFNKSEDYTEKIQFINMMQLHCNNHFIVWKW